MMGEGLTGHQLLGETPSQVLQEARKLGNQPWPAWTLTWLSLQMTQRPASSLT